MLLRNTSTRLQQRCGAVKAPREGTKPIGTPLSSVQHDCTIHRIRRFPGRDFELDLLFRHYNRSTIPSLKRIEVDRCGSHVPEKLIPLRYADSYGDSDWSAEHRLHQTAWKEEQCFAGRKTGTWVKRAGKGFTRRSLL